MMDIVLLRHVEGTSMFNKDPKSFVLLTLIALIVVVAIIVATGGQGA